MFLEANLDKLSETNNIEDIQNHFTKKGAA